MKTLRPLRRSISPFAPLTDAPPHPLEPVKLAFQKVWPKAEGKIPKELKSFDQAPFVPLLIEKMWEAPANDAPQLDNLIQFLLRFRESLEAAGLQEAVYTAMQELFDRKTEMFMVDHHDKANCEQMGWADEYRDVVLFSRERDALVGRYFAPVNEAHPGRFSALVGHWSESENPDRLLHFLDFCAGAKNPTFEHYLLFTHPALARLLKNKPQLKAMSEKSQPVLAKLTSPTWEKNTRLALGL